MTLRDYVALHCEGRTLSKQYVYQLGWTVQAFDQWNRRPVRLNQLSMELIDQWIRSLLHRKKPRPVTRASAAWFREALLSLWRSAHEAGLTRRAPPSAKYKAPPGTTIYSRRKPKPKAVYRRKLTITQYVKVYQGNTGCRDNSAEQFRIAAQSLERFAGRSVYVDEFCPQLVNDWLAYMLLHMKPVTCRCRKIHLVGLWRNAHAHGYCPTPAVPGHIRTIRIGPRLTTAWTVDQVRKLVVTARALEGHFPHGKLLQSTFWELAVRTAWDSGLRLGDFLTAQQGDFNDAGEAAIVQSKTQRPIFVRLLPKTLILLEQTDWRARKTLLPLPYGRERFRKQFDRLVKASGLEGTFKKIRKSTATNIEMRHPGWGAIHLGHLTGFKTADAHYFDFRIIAQKKPDPEEL